jgi:hypothetical protein
MTLQAKPKKGSREGLSDAAVTGLNLNGLGSAEVVSIEWINVDSAYQRDLRHDLVNEIARGWDIVKAGPILLSVREDGTLWCVDGQHRLAGAQQAGESEMFAHVVHGLTQAQEAELRLARNVRRGDTIAEKFRTRLVMGDPKAHQIIELIAQQHTQVNLVPNSAHGINAIATVELLYDIDGTGVWLVRTLRAIREAYSEGEDFYADDIDPCMTPATCSTSMMKAVCWFLGQHIDIHEISYTEWVERLGSVGVDDIRRKAVSHKAANGGALWLNTYRALVEVWNFRRTDAKKLQWKTIGSLTHLGGAGVRTTPWEGVDTVRP